MEKRSLASNQVSAASWGPTGNSARNSAREANVEDITRYVGGEAKTRGRILLLLGDVVVINAN